MIRIIRHSICLFSSRLSSRFLVLLLIACIPAAELVAQQPTYQPPALSDSDSWSMVLLPDPQTYNKFARNQPVFELMTAWVADNIASLNIKLVLCTGDLVEQNEMLNPDGVNGDQPSKSQWEAVAHAFGRLDGKVPYVSATGNHDYGYKSIEHRRSNFDHYFPVDKNLLTQPMIREVGLSIEDKPTLANAAFELILPDDRKFLVLNLEFAPRDTTLAWANKVVSLEKYKDHKVILLTHSYMNSRNEHIVKEGYPITDANYGAAIFEKLVRPSRNIEMVFAGHIGAPDNPKGHIAFRTDKNAAGKKVQQMVFNAQALGGGWHGNGGDGWLRILEFLPDGKTVHVKTFSPLFAFSPATRQLAWRTAPHDQFSFTLD